MHGSILAVTTPRLSEKVGPSVPGVGNFPSNLAPGVTGGANLNTSSHKDLWGGTMVRTACMEFFAGKSAEFVNEWLDRNNISKLKSLF